MKRVICVDVDGVLGDFASHCLPRLNEACGADWCLDDWTAFYPKDWVPSEHAARATSTVKALTGTVGWTADLSPYAGALDALHRLASDFDVVILTSISDAEVEHRERWLLGHGFPIAGLVACPGPLKGEVCKMLGAVALVEDSAENAVAAADAGVHAFLIDRPWNRAVDDQRVRRVLGYDDLVDAVRGI